MFSLGLVLLMHFFGLEPWTDIFVLNLATRINTCLIAQSSLNISISCPKLNKLSSYQNKKFWSKVILLITSA